MVQIKNSVTQIKTFPELVNCSRIYYRSDTSRLVGDLCPIYSVILHYNLEMVVATFPPNILVSGKDQIQLVAKNLTEEEVTDKISCEH
jgi:hypothetical protein